MPIISLNQATELSGFVSTILNQSYLDLQKEDITRFRNLLIAMPPISGRDKTDVFFDDFIPTFKVNEFEASPQTTIKARNVTLRLQKRALEVAIAKLDSTGQFEPVLRERAEQQARAAELFARDDIIDILNLGTTTEYIGYDGVPFFSLLHPKGLPGETYANLFNGALDAANLAAGLAAARRIPSDAGLAFPLDIIMNWLVVPPELYLLAQQLVTSAQSVGIITLADNQVRGVCEVLTDAKLTDPNDWFLLSAGRNTAGDGGAGAFPDVISETTTSYIMEVLDGNRESRPDYWLYSGYSFELVNMGHPYRAQKWVAP